MHWHTHTHTQPAVWHSPLWADLSQAPWSGQLLIVKQSAIPHKAVSSIGPEPGSHRVSVLKCVCVTSFLKHMNQTQEKMTGLLLVRNTTCGLGKSCWCSMGKHHAGAMLSLPGDQRPWLTYMPLPCQQKRMQSNRRTGGRRVRDRKSCINSLIIYPPYVQSCVGLAGEYQTLYIVCSQWWWCRRFTFVSSLLLSLYISRFVWQHLALWVYATPGKQLPKMYWHYYQEIATDINSLKKSSSVWKMRYLPHTLAECELIKWWNDCWLIKLSIRYIHFASG